MNNHDRPSAERAPWNKGKFTGAKPPLRPKHVWLIRSKLQLSSICCIDDLNPTFYCAAVFPEDSFSSRPPPMRTLSPAAIPSGGLTITRSSGLRPDAISTVLPRSRAILTGLSTTRSVLSSVAIRSPFRSKIRALAGTLTADSDPAPANEPSRMRRSSVVRRYCRRRAACA